MKSVFTEGYELFLKSLIAARKKAGVTQEALAQRLGKPQSFVSKYERRERRLDVVEFIVIAHTLGFDPCRIVREVEQQVKASAKSGTFA